MSIYEILKKYHRNKNAFKHTPEYDFFMKNRDVLHKIKKFEYLYSHDNSEFDVIRANVVIQAYNNKLTIEEEIANIVEVLGENKIDNRQILSILKEKIIDLPYLMSGKQKIYVPIFNAPLNSICTRYPDKLLVYPYNQLLTEFSESIIDLFDVYGAKLYDSYFTRLIKISESNKEVAFYNYDTNTIYIVNDQGRLDQEIVLFDRFIKKPVTNHMLERLRPVVDAYFKNDKEGFINALIENNFVSERLLNIIKK